MGYGHGRFNLRTVVGQIPILLSAQAEGWHPQGFAWLFACSARARLRIDRRGLCTRNVHSGCTCVSPQGSHRRDQHRGSPPASEHRKNARTRQCAYGGSCRTGPYQQCIHPVRASSAGQGLKQPSLGRRPSLSSKVFGLNEIYRMA